MLDGVYPQITSSPSDYFQNRTDLSAAVTPNSEHEEKVSDNRRVRTMPGQEEVGPDGKKKDTLELSQEAEEIRKLQMRDREVRTHEAAHSAAGGAYAGAASFTYQKGPDGRSYAIGGEVSIDIAAVPGDPKATMQKAQQVRAAALAPAQPSSQDIKVAQRAQAMAAEARMEMVNEQAEELSEITGSASTDQSEEAGESNSVAPEAKAKEVAPVVNSRSVKGDISVVERLSIYA